MNESTKFYDLWHWHINYVKQQMRWTC